MKQNNKKRIALMGGLVFALGVAGISLFKAGDQAVMSQAVPGPSANQSVVSEAGRNYQEVGSTEAADLIAKTPSLIIIDVSPDYDRGHLPGAVNYYIGDGSLDRAIPELDKNKPYLVYCHTDTASKAGAQKLVDAGFMEVYRLAGNYAAWIEAGLPIEK